jgi:hypothetical protein
VFKKSFLCPMKIISLILVISCSILFTELANTQPKDNQGSSTTEEKDNSNNSNSFFYIAVAAVLVVGAIYFLVAKNPNEDKKTDNEKNMNAKDSTNLNKPDTTKIKKKDELRNIDGDVQMFRF